MKLPQPTISSTFAFKYISLMIIGAAVHELLNGVLYPAIQSSQSIAISILMLVAIPTAGLLWISNKNIASKITSVSMMLMLAFIALRIGHSVVPDSYLLVMALFISLLGSASAFHVKINGTRLKMQTLATVVVTSVLIYAFTTTMLALDRLAI